MTEETDIPFPILFNPFKHHHKFILEILQNTPPELIAGMFDAICNNYVDIYTGTKTPTAIAYGLISILKSNQAILSDDFKLWVGSKTGYRIISLEDGSEWIVRVSSENERYVHIHPARSGPFSMRFKGSTLKTAYLLKSGFTGLPETISLDKVNQIREQIGLSPIKKLERSKGILNCLEIFFNTEIKKNEPHTDQS